MHGQKKTLSIFLVPGFSISSAVALMLLLLVVVVIIVYLMHLSCGFDEALFSFFLSFFFFLSPLSSGLKPVFFFLRHNLLSAHRKMGPTSQPGIPLERTM